MSSFAAAGVSLGRVQHHFSSKRELITESCRTMLSMAERSYEQDATLEYAVGHALPKDDRARRGIVIWNAYLNLAATDGEIAAMLAEAKRGQEEEVARLIGGKDALARARGLIALADGLVQRILIGDSTYKDAHAVLQKALGQAAEASR